MTTKSIIKSVTPIPESHNELGETFIGATVESSYGRTVDLEIKVANNPELDNSSVYTASNIESGNQGGVKHTTKIPGNLYIGVTATEDGYTGLEYPDVAFERPSIAYHQGQEYAANEPIFDSGLQVYEGTTNLYPEALATGSSWNTLSGSTVTITPSQPDPFGGTNAYRVQSSGGTAVLKANTSAGIPADGVQWTGQIWVRNRGMTNLILYSNQGFVVRTVPPNSDWEHHVWTITGNGFGSAQHQLRAETVDGSIDCDVCFLQYEEKPYPTPWTIGTRASEKATLTLPEALPEEFGIGVTVRPDWGSAAQKDIYRRVFGLNPGNALSITWNRDRMFWYCYEQVDGIAKFSSCPVTAFNAGDEIKFYLLVTGGQFRLYSSLGHGDWQEYRGSGYNAMNLGSNGMAEHLNGTLFNLVIDTSPSESKALAYLGGE